MIKEASDTSGIKILFFWLVCMSKMPSWISFLMSINRDSGPLPTFGMFTIASKACFFFLIYNMTGMRCNMIWI